MQCSGDVPGINWEFLGMDRGGLVLATQLSQQLL